jgi:hypothetical protein
LVLANGSIRAEFIQHSLALNNAIAFSQASSQRSCLFFQDGVFNAREQISARHALQHQPKLFMCGTAPMLLANTGANDTPENNRQAQIFSQLAHSTQYFTARNQSGAIL